MQFRFDANQEYQVRAIESVVDLLEGQPRIEPDLALSLGSGIGAVPNRLDLDEHTLLANLGRVQEQNKIPVDPALELIEETIETADGERQTRFANFSVEMETGTGKTYVYIRTVLELFQRVGLRKFIVVVPSIAVREGVLKTLRVTEQHLRELYGNVAYRYYVYDSENLAQVRQFALSNSVEIMVMTIDSFNKASNVIRQSTDRLQGATPIHLVQTARPVLILDEPQNMESEARVRALAALDPLFALRYSATHKWPYNVVYRLTPYDAYRQGLVKKIEVASVVQSDDENRPFLRLDAIRAEKKTLTARIAVHKLMANGTVKERGVTVRPGDRLEEKANRSEYAPYVVDEINAAAKFVTFTNGEQLQLGESQGTDREAIFRAQIAYTIGEHMRKQERLRSQGIKVLSLFFIDRVDNYAREDGVIRRLFLEAFDSLKTGHSRWRSVEPELVQAAYFAERRTRDGVMLEDSRTGEAERDRQAYELIMRKKEELLSLGEPVSFIFSHSALREGWDNPNVFQICTLNQTASEMKKRQEVGRGIRLAVNQEGERVHHEGVNVLTVVANESYERYVDRLQAETEAEYGTEGLPPKPANARKRRTARLRKQYTLKPEFKELWERIKHKTRYAVQIDSEKLIRDVVAALDTVTVAKPRVTITKAVVDVRDGQEGYEAIRATGQKTVAELPGHPLPDLLRTIQELLEHTTPPVRLTRRTLLDIYRGTAQKQAALDNPYGFALEAVRIIKEKLAEQLVDGIQYEKIDEWYEMTQWGGTIEGWEEYLVRADKSLYSLVECESDVERRFARDLDRRPDVRMFVKLPSWFTVPTPVGDYNPDWAVVMDDGDEDEGRNGQPVLYLVSETKGTTRLEDLRPDERRKIQCGDRHFSGALGVRYKLATSANDLP